MVGNIRGDDIATGTTLCDYLQPFPPFGAGYFRFGILLDIERHWALAAHKSWERHRITLRKDRARLPVLRS